MDAAVLPGAENGLAVGAASGDLVRKAGTKGVRNSGHIRLWWPAARNLLKHFPGGTGQAVPFRPLSLSLSENFDQGFIGASVTYLSTFR